MRTQLYMEFKHRLRVFPWFYCQLLNHNFRPIGPGDHEIGDHEIGDHEIGNHEIGDHEIGDHEIGDHEIGDI